MYYINISPPWKFNDVLKYFHIQLLLNVIFIRGIYFSVDFQITGLGITFLTNNTGFELLIPIGNKIIFNITDGHLWNDFKSNLFSFYLMGECLRVIWFLVSWHLEFSRWTYPTDTPSVVSECHSNYFRGIKNFVTCK